MIEMTSKLIIVGSDRGGVGKTTIALVSMRLSVLATTAQGWAGELQRLILPTSMGRDSVMQA
jgi:hypothetical protein